MGRHRIFSRNQCGLGLGLVLIKTIPRVASLIVESYIVLLFQHLIANIKEVSMLKGFSLFFVVLSCLQVTWSQTADEIRREAYPEVELVVDNSPRAQLWRQVVAAKMQDNEALHAALNAQFMQEYGNQLSIVPQQLDGPQEVAFAKSFHEQDWGPGDVMVAQGAILSEITAGNGRSIRFRVDSLGNKYAGVLYATRDSIDIFKSTDEGLTWTRLLRVTPGGSTKWHSFDMFVTDSADVHRIGIAASRTSGIGSFDGQLYWMTIRDNGAGFRAQLIENRPTGRGHINPAIVSDGYSWSTGSTFWYVAYQNSDSATGTSIAAVAALSQNWGYAWITDTARVSFNDFDLDIEYNFRADTIHVLLTNDLTVTNPNLRIRRISLGDFGSSVNWVQYNPASTSDPEFDGVLVSNRQSNELLCMYTRTQSGNDDIGYAYSPTGTYPDANWITGLLLASQSNTENKVDADCQESQGAYRVSYFADGATQDTIFYRSAFDPSSFGGKTAVNVQGGTSPSVFSSVAGFRQSASGFGGGVLFAGFGPSDVFYDGSNISVSVDEERGVPDEFELSQNYPNPFNPETEIRFRVPTASHVTLTVYNVLGREVATLVNDQLAPGSYTAKFGSADLASGTYFYRLQSGNTVVTKKMLLLK